MFKYINEAEAKRLKLSRKNYLKYSHLIYQENRINVEKEFQIVIYLNYKSKKGKIKDKFYKKYDSNMFLKIYEKYKNLKEERELYRISSKVERSVMTNGMRYDVLKRDKFRCQVCGATQKDGVTLHVDHIIPVSKGGKTEMSNLQTLCSKCNIGKSNKL